MATAAAGGRARPTNLKVLEGRGNGRDSGGRRIKQPPGFLRLPPSKPDGLSVVAAELWDVFVEELQRLQLTKPLDGPALEMGCETYSRWHEARAMRRDRGLLSENSQGQVTAPWVGIEERASKEFRAWAAEFGLTPAAEVKVAQMEAKDADDEGAAFG